MYLILMIYVYIILFQVHRGFANLHRRVFIWHDLTWRFATNFAMAVS